MSEQFRYQAKTQEDKEEIKNAEKQNESRDIELFFEGFIKNSRVIRTKEFSKDFSVTLTPCTVEQLLEAELVLRGNNPGIPIDTMARLRSCSILSYAILKIGNLEIRKPEEDADKNINRRLALYQQLLSLPPVLVREIYDFYLETVEEQEKMFASPKELGDKIENF